MDPSEKQAGRRRKKVTKAEPVAASPVVPPAVVDPTARRQELLAKLHKRQVEARYSRGLDKVAAMATQSIKKMTGKYAAGTPNQGELKHLAEMEEALEDCGGNIELFCRRQGLDERVIPEIMKATELLKPRADGTTASNLDRVAADLVKSLRKGGFGT